MSVSFPHGTPSPRGAAVVWVPITLVVLAAVAWLVWQSGRTAVGATPTHTVARETLRLSVEETGALTALRSEDLRCEVEGRTTVIYLIEEGTRVEAGDLLVKLDSSALEDRLVSQQSRYEQAYSSWVKAREDLAIQQSTNDSNIRQGELAVTLAKDALKKFEEGDLELRRKQNEENAKLYEEELEQAIKEWEDTKELVELDFETPIQERADFISKERSRIKLETETLRQDLEDRYDIKRDRLIFEADVFETGKELERVQHKAVADEEQQKAELSFRKRALDLAALELQEVKDQLGHVELYAPIPGLVVYPANSQGRGHGGSDRNRVEEGTEVRERQLLVSLPDTSQMRVSVDMHESALSVVEVGQPVLVTVDALPDKTFVGTLTSIAPLPDSQSWWSDPDLKVYPCEITLTDETKLLRPGMSAKVEIVVAELLDSIAVPLEAVHRLGTHHFCYLASSSGPQIRELTVGPTNYKQVAILDGLEPGDEIYLDVPPNAPAPGYEDIVEELEMPSLDELRAIASQVDVAELRTNGSEDE